MIKGLYEAGKAMQYKMKNLDIIANNLANISTTGYKREIPFAEQLETFKTQKLEQLTDFAEGAFLNTDNPLDLAISGNAFFMIETDKGIELTKNGKFKISEEGNLITDEGFKVITNSGDLNIFETFYQKQDKLTVTKNGEIKFGNEVVDRLSLAKIDNQQNMIRTPGQNFYFADQNFVPADEAEYKIEQGFLEEANTNAIMEMQEMIRLNKDYETSQKIINSLDQIMGRTREIGSV